MYERSLNEAELILRRESGQLLSVRTVWEEVVKRSKIAGFDVTTLADFSAMLEGDRRFQIIPARVEGEEHDEELPTSEGLDEAEMEQLGFFPEDRVKLKTLRTVEEQPSEDEEVGSIRRRAFINQEDSKKKVKSRDRLAISVKTKKRASLKKRVKKSLKKPPSMKRRQAIQSRKSKKRTRSKT